jgi:hypothetical protein
VSIVTQWEWLVTRQQSSLAPSSSLDQRQLRPQEVPENRHLHELRGRRGVGSAGRDRQPCQAEAGEVR